MISSTMASRWGVIRIPWARSSSTAFPVPFPLLPMEKV
jgi:hypothetical protein